MRAFSPPLLAAALSMILPVPGLAKASARPATTDAVPAIAGRVADPTGAGIPGVVVLVRTIATGSERVVVTADDGQFRVVLPTRDPVRLTVAHEGFAPLERTVAPGDQVGALVLQPAAVIEQVAVVSESRQAQLREALSSRVDVVTRSRMEDSAAVTVADALQEMPGVLTRRGTETAGAAGEQIQGIDSRQVLVLIDGQPVVGARGIKRGAINLDRQSVSRLERVEVVKGASSALYGSDAIGGVINMITRQPARPLEVAGATTWGSYGDASHRAEGGGRHGRLSGFGTIERRDHDGFDLTPTTPDTTGAPTRRLNGLLKAQLQVTSSLALHALATAYTADTEGRSVGELGPQADDIDERALNTGVTADWQAGPLTMVQLRGYHARYDETSNGRLLAGGPLPAGALRERLTKLDTSIARAFGARQYLQGGVEWWDNTYDGINRLRGDEPQGVTTGVVWAQHRLAIGSRVTTTAGLRLDRHSVFGTALSPKLALNARVTDTLRARASYGRGFRAPDLGQLFYRFLNPTNFYQVIGNPSLKPETADSYQAGLEYQSPARRVRLGANVFRNDVADLIESVSLGMVTSPAHLQALIAREGIDPSFSPTLGRLLFVYRNVAEARTEGIEADGEVALSSQWSLGGAYTALRARDRRTDLALTNRHPHQGHLRIAWQAASLGLRANLRGTFYSGWIAARAATDGNVIDTRAPRFALWDAYVSRGFGRGLTVFASVNNLADSTDPNLGVTLPDGSVAPLYRPEVGRTVRAGLRVEWTRK